MLSTFLSVACDRNVAACAAGDKLTSGPADSEISIIQATRFLMSLSCKNTGLGVLFLTDILGLALFEDHISDSGIWLVLDVDVCLRL